MNVRHRNTDRKIIIVATKSSAYWLQLCRECFYEVFEEEVHQTIVSNKLFKAGEKVAIGASGMRFKPCNL